MSDWLKLSRGIRFLGSDLTGLGDCVLHRFWGCDVTAGASTQCTTAIILQGGGGGREGKEEEEMSEGEGGKKGR